MLPNSNQPHLRYSTNPNQYSKEPHKAFYHSNNDPEPFNLLSSLNKNRNLSLHDLKPQNHLKGSIMQSSMLQSEHGGREIKKLRMRIQELEKENKSLYNLNIQFQEQAKIWQEKARSLNDQLIRYQNIELQHTTANAYEARFNQELLQNEEIRQLKRLVIILEETNNENIKRVEALSTQLEIQKRQSAKIGGLRESHQKLSIYCQQLEEKLQRKTREHKQVLVDLQKMEEELEYMGKEIPNKISMLQSQNLEINNREKQQLKEQIRSLETNLSDIQKLLRQETEENERQKAQNTQLRKELQVEKERCYNYQKINQQLSRQNNSSVYQQLKDKEEQLIAVNHELSCLSKRNHTIFEDLLSKDQSINELTSRNRLLQDQISSLNAQIAKYHAVNASNRINLETEQVNMSLERELNTYKQSIQQIRKTNEDQLKKNEQKYQRILLERQEEQRSLKQQVENLQQQIKQMEVAHSNQKFELVQSVDMDIKEFGKMAKEQQIEIAEIHKNYCEKIDKLMQENFTLRNKMKATQNNLHSQLQLKNRQLKKSEEYSFSANRLQMEIQKLELRLKQETKLTAELHERLVASQQRYQQTDLIAKQMTLKMKDYRMEIEQLNQQNQKWRSYRRSEEQDARMECRRYKKLVEQLQLKLKDVQQIEVLRKTCDQLRSAMNEQEKHSNKLLFQETKRFTDSIDEMQAEMRKILRECQNKISEKQLQIDAFGQQNIQTSLQLKEMNERYRYSALQFQKTIADLHQVELDNDQLKNQNAMSRSQLLRLQNLLKKLDADNQSLKYSSEAQKDFIKTRYDKDMQDKVTEIQRLKLQVAQLSEQLKKNTINKKQVEGIQTILRNKQMEIKESQQRNNYLEDIIQTYQGEIKSFKALRDKDANQKRSIEENMIALQRKTSQLESDKEEIARTNKLNEQKYREWKYKCQQLQFQNRKLQGRINQLQVQERQANKKIKDQQHKINQLNFELNHLNRASDERWQDQQEINSLKMIIQQYQSNQKKVRKYEIQLQDIKEKYEKQIALTQQLSLQVSQQHKEKAKIVRQNDSKINQINQAARRQAKLRSQLDDLRQKLVFLQDRIKVSVPVELGYVKQKKIEIDQLKSTYELIIEQQKSLIKELNDDQTSKLRQIQILLSRIAFLEGDAIVRSSKISQNAQLDINKRVGWYLKMCSLNLVGNTRSKLSFDGNEELFLAIVYETIKVLSNILGESIQELNAQKKTVLELTAERDNFHNKYIKYKSIATDYKERKEVQRQVLKNSYRFNEQIINHCQDILKERK